MRAAASVAPTTTAHAARHLHAANAQQRCLHALRSRRVRCQPATANPQAAAAAAAVCSTLSTPAGQVTIQPLGANDVQGAALLLTRAFAGTAEAVKLDEALKYMQERLEGAASGTCLTLVARLVPADPALLPPGKDSRLVGTVSLSFTAGSREAFDSLAPPADEPYLANMAVDPKFRRQGIARAMLIACDAAVQQAGPEGCTYIWLHVRQADAAAQQLYTGYDYQEQGRDKPAKAALFGFGVGGGSAQRPRILMRRQLLS